MSCSGCKGGCQCVILPGSDNVTISGSGNTGQPYYVTVTGGTGGGGTSDHGSLTGLTDDDHPQYALASGGRGNFAPTAHQHPASDITSGSFTVARIGSGTPAAGKYVDGGTGAWTALPSGGAGGITSTSVGTIEATTGVPPADPTDLTKVHLWFNVGADG